MDKKLANQIKKLGSVLSGLANIVEEIDKEESAKETDKRGCNCANLTPYHHPGCGPCPPRLAYLSYQYPYTYPVLVLEQAPGKKSNYNSEEDISGAHDSTRPRKQVSKNKHEEEDYSDSSCNNDEPRKQTSGNRGHNSGSSSSTGKRDLSKTKHEEEYCSDSSCNNEPQKQTSGNRGDNNNSGSSSSTGQRNLSKTKHEEECCSGSFSSNGQRKESGNIGDNNSGSFSSNGLRKLSLNGNEGNNNSGSFSSNGRRQSINGNEGDNNSGSFYNNYTSNTNYEDNKCRCAFCNVNNDCYNGKPCICCLHTNSNTSRGSNNSQKRRSNASDNLQGCNCRVNDFRRRKTDLQSCCVQCFPD